MPAHRSADNAEILTYMEELLPVTLNDDGEQFCTCIIRMATTSQGIRTSKYLPPNTAGYQSPFKWW